MTVRPAVWLVAAVVIVLDQATKQWALIALSDGQNIPLIGDFLSLELVFNSGAAFSLGDGATWIVTLVVLFITMGIVYYARRAQSNVAAILFGIGLGGAIGNLIDRLFRDPGFGRGHVVDMINYNNFFVGNIADIAIVGAAIVAVILGFMGKALLVPAEGEPAAQDQSEDTAADVSQDDEAKRD